jgi:hypothetical protein
MLGASLSACVKLHPMRLYRKARWLMLLRVGRHWVCNTKASPRQTAIAITMIDTLAKEGREGERADIHWQYQQGIKNGLSDMIMKNRSASFGGNSKLLIDLPIRLSPRINDVLYCLNSIVKWELKSDHSDIANWTGFILHNISHVVYRDFEDWCIRYHTKFTDVFVEVGQKENGLPHCRMAWLDLIRVFVATCPRLLCRRHMVSQNCMFSIFDQSIHLV